MLKHVCLVALALVPAATRAQTSAAAFIQSIGVDTHMAYTDGRYRDVGRVLAHLDYLGIKVVRDGISNGKHGSTGLGTYVRMAQAGVKWTFLVSAGGVETDASLNDTLGLIRTVEQRVPGSVRFIEGTNEINNYPVLWNGGTARTGQAQLDSALAMQRQLYASVHADPVLRHVKVAMFTGAKAGTIPASPDPGRVPGLADVVTQHPYPNRGDPPAFWLAPAQATPGMSGPVIYTETGYSSNGGTAGAVDPEVQARYGLDLLCDAAKLGVVQTTWYQLLDAYPKGSRQGNDGTGLFDVEGAPKPIAVALHNLTTIMDEPAGPRSRAAPAAPMVDGLPKSGQSLALTRADGSTDLLVWAEPPIWNRAGGMRTPAPTAKVTVTFEHPVGVLSVFDPLVGTDPIRQARNTRTVELEITDHPLIVRAGRP